MNQFIENVLNPPQDVKKKQIWYSNEAKREFLIIDDKDIKNGLLKTVLVSRVTELEDGIDLLLTKKNFDYLASDRLALRFTVGPIHKEQLTYYLGSIDNETFTKVKDTLNRTNENNYDEIEQNVLAEILEELEPLRQNSIKLYEDNLSNSTSILYLPIVNKNSEIEENEPYFSDRLAADDVSATSIEYNFWELEENSEEASQNIIDRENISIKLSIIENNLYLIVYSSVSISLTEVSIKQNDQNVEATPNKINLKEPGRAALYFDKSKITSGKAELIFSLDDVKEIETITFE